MAELDFDLMKSKLQIGELYPLLEDAKGNMIDGHHRERADSTWTRKKLEQIDTEAKLWLARIAANTHRREIPRKERIVQMSELAKCLIRDEGVSKERLVDVLVELTTFSKGYIYRILPDEFKRRPFTKAKEELEPLRTGMTPEEVLKRYTKRQDDEFLVMQLVVYSALKTNQAKKIVDKWKRGKVERTKKEKELIKQIEMDGSGKKSVINTREKVTQIFAKLSEYYSPGIIDMVTTITPSTNLQTLIKYCRRYTSKLHEKASLELRQAVLLEFR